MEPLTDRTLHFRLPARSVLPPVPTIGSETSRRKAVLRVKEENAFCAEHHLRHIRVSLVIYGENSFVAMARLLRLPEAGGDTAA